jgi:5,10-methylenetetrahydrofolate reductase
MSQMQLEINYSSRGNRLRDALAGGDFVLLIEGAAPDPRNREPAPGLDHLNQLLDAIPDITGFHTGLAILDRGVAVQGAWRAIELASAMSEEDRDRHLVYLSGCDTDIDSAKKLLQIADNAGVRNIVAVSGDAPPGASASACSKHTFTESVDLLRAAAEYKHSPNGGFLAGGVINPHQYTPWALFGQYKKSDVKFANGAEFVVAQAGWDMLKLQALAWHMTGTELYYPRIARLMLLTPGRVEQILSSEVPGVRISKQLKKQLEHELCFSKSQFEAAQYRRIALQAAGCRLMGYNGIQLAGAESPLRARVAAEHIRAALDEFTSFQAWIEEYNVCMAESEVSAFGDAFALYDRILHCDYPEDAPPSPRDPGEPELGLSERALYNCRKFFFAEADKQNAGHHLFLKKMLCGCRSCDECKLPQHDFICYKRCPKQMCFGPCGGVTVDGRCETNDFECIHHQIERLRASTKIHSRNKAD